MYDSQNRSGEGQLMLWVMGFDLAWRGVQVMDSSYGSFTDGLNVRI